VKRDHGPPLEGAASFYTTSWTIVMRATKNQMLGTRSALAGLSRLDWYPLSKFTGRRRKSLNDARDLTQRLFLHLVASDGRLDR